MLFKRTLARATEAEILKMRLRAQRVREQVSAHGSDVKLADLFGLVGEDDRFGYVQAQPEPEPSIRRVRPDEV